MCNLGERKLGTMPRGLLYLMMLAAAYLHIKIMSNVQTPDSTNQIEVLRVDWQSRWSISPTKKVRSQEQRIHCSLFAAGWHTCPLSNNIATVLRYENIEATCVIAIRQRTYLKKNFCWEMNVTRG